MFNQCMEPFRNNRQGTFAMVARNENRRNVDFPTYNIFQVFQPRHDTDLLDRQNQGQRYELGLNVENEEEAPFLKSEPLSNTRWRPLQEQKGYTNQRGERPQTNQRQSRVGRVAYQKEQRYNRWRERAQQYPQQQEPRRY